MLKRFNFFEIPVGKQFFTATVEDIYNTIEYSYHGNKEIPVQYLYLTDLKNLIDDNFVDVECANVPIVSKIGKRLEKLNLEKGDVISFNAQVYEQEISFYYLEGEEPPFNSNEKFPFLPKSYKGKIIAEIYETGFWDTHRLWKRDYTKYYSRSKFNKVYEKLNINRKATDTQPGLYRKSELSYIGRGIKNLSHITKQSKTDLSSIYSF